VCVLSRILKTVFLVFEIFSFVGSESFSHNHLNFSLSSHVGISTISIQGAISLIQFSTLSVFSQLFQVFQIISATLT
jgi:hypothetical protein